MGKTMQVEKRSVSRTDGGHWPNAFAEKRDKTGYASDGRGNDGYRMLSYGMYDRKVKRSETQTGKEQLPDERAKMSRIES